MNHTPYSPNHPVVLLATWFGIGEISKAPGTLASLAALPFAYGIVTFFGTGGLIIAAILALIIGAKVSELYMERNKLEHDASVIVIDEIAGQWVLLLAFPNTLNGMLVAFILFRLFDIWKPWPISRIDRTAKGGPGVMLDDFAAGIMPGILYTLFIFILLMTGHGDRVEAIYTFLNGNGIF